MYYGISEAFYVGYRIEKYLTTRIAQVHSTYKQTKDLRHTQEMLNRKKSISNQGRVFSDIE